MGNPFQSPFVIFHIFRKHIIPKGKYYVSLEHEEVELTEKTTPYDFHRMILYVGDNHSNESLKWLWKWYQTGKYGEIRMRFQSVDHAHSRCTRDRFSSCFVCFSFICCFSNSIPFFLALSPIELISQKKCPVSAFKIRIDASHKCSGR